MEITARTVTARFATFAPIVYGGLMLAYLLACLEVLEPSLSEALLWPATVAKWATVIAIPLTLLRFGRVLEDRPSNSTNVWWQLGLLWAVLGVGIVLMVVPVGERIARASAKPSASRIWPGTDMAAERDLFVASSPSYNLFTVVAVELVAVLVLALVSALCVRVTSRTGASMIATLPVALVGTLGFYAFGAPGAWIWDYDPFIGDVILGGVLAELVNFVAPTDPVGAVALATGVSSVAAASARVKPDG